MVEGGDDLKSLAQKAYGNSCLWYVLAAANALSGDSGLIAGTQLKVPEVGVSKNDSGTFKPYNPNEIVGSTSPSLPFIPPPNGCNSFAVVLTSAILFIAAPYLLPVISSVGGFAGAVIVGAATFTANAVATAVGSVIGANSFSWRASVREGVIAGLTFGLGKLDVLAKLGPISRVIQSSEFTKVAAQAVLNKGIDIAASKATGLEHSAFSWKGIAIQAVTQKIVKPVMDRLSENVFNKIENPMQQRLIGELTGGLVTEAVSVGVRRSLGIEARFNLGAALGNAFAAAIRPDFLALSGKDEAGPFGLDAGKSTGSNFGGFIPSMGYGPHRAGAAYSDEDAAGVASVGLSAAEQSKVVGLSAAEQSKVIDTVQVKGNRDGSTYVWNPSTQQWGYGNSVILDAASGKIIYSKPIPGYAKTGRTDGYINQMSGMPGSTKISAATLALFNAPSRFSSMGPGLSGIVANINQASSGLNSMYDIPLSKQYGMRAITSHDKALMAQQEHLASRLPSGNFEQDVAAGINTAAPFVSPYAIPARALALIKLTGATLGGVSNATAQLAIKGDQNEDGITNRRDLDRTDIFVATATGYFSAGKGYVANLGISEGGYIAQETLNGKPLTMQGATATAIGTTAGYGAGKLASNAVSPYVQWSVKTTVPISLYENLIPPKAMFGFVFPTRTFNSAIPAALNMTSAPFTGEFTTQYIDQLNRPPYKSTTGP